MRIMDLSASTVIFILSCGLLVVEARMYNSVLTVPNGGRWGRWGPVQICPKGYAFAFQIKEEPYRMKNDATGLNAITLWCDEGDILTSTSGPWGIWQNVQYCRKGKLVAFGLRVQEEISGDNTAANNILFLCSDDTILLSNGTHRGSFGRLSKRCENGSICGIQTKVQDPQFDGDDTALNDVRMYCCD